MIIENCAKCGGTHIGSLECPFDDKMAAELKRASEIKPSDSISEKDATKIRDAK